MLAAPAVKLILEHFRGRVRLGNRREFGQRRAQVADGYAGRDAVGVDG